MTGNDHRLGEQTDRVWIDQDLCTGDGLCAQLAPEVFELDIDGLAYVKGENGQPERAPGHRVPVPSELEPAVKAAVADCPGACIFLASCHPAVAGD